MGIAMPDEGSHHDCADQHGGANVVCGVEGWIANKAANESGTGTDRAEAEIESLAGIPGDSEKNRKNRSDDQKYCRESNTSADSRMKL